MTNTGKRAGDEVVQLYVQHLGSEVARPRKDLRAYRRITLVPGETRAVALTLPASSLAYWNAEMHRWVLEDEAIGLEVGASSADIRQNLQIRVTGAR